MNKYLEKIIAEEFENYKIENSKLIQDPIGGMIRPDQMEFLIADALKQCLLMIEQQKQFNFSSLLKIAAMRAETLSELYEDLDDEEGP